MFLFTKTGLWPEENVTGFLTGVQAVEPEKLNKTVNCELYHFIYLHIEAQY